MAEDVGFRHWQENVYPQRMERQSKEWRELLEQLERGKAVSKSVFQKLLVRFLVCVILMERRLLSS